MEAGNQPLSELEKTNLLLAEIETVLSSMLQACSEAMTTKESKNNLISPQDCVLLMSLDMYKAYSAFIHLVNDGVLEPSSKFWKNCLKNSDLTQFRRFEILTINSDEGDATKRTIIVHHKKSLERLGLKKFIN